jgi:hypothetical protein
VAAMEVMKTRRREIIRYSKFGSETTRPASSSQLCVPARRGIALSLGKR